MKLNLEVKEKIVELDEVMNEEEMELPPFQFALEELSQYINGSIEVLFNNGNSIYLDLFYGFSICYEDIVESCLRVITNCNCSDYIWFCEQGDDFYFYYDIKEEALDLSYKKGADAGNYYKSIPDFTIEIPKLEYINEWKKIFQKLSELFEEKLNKKIALPF